MSSDDLHRTLARKARFLSHAWVGLLIQHLIGRAWESKHVASDQLKDNCMTLTLSAADREHRYFTLG